MFDAFISNSAARWNVPENWIRAVIQTESSWNPNATSAGGDRGLMQISQSTAALYGWDWSRMYDPQLNIDSGTQLLGDLRQRIGDDFGSVYSAYNSGDKDAWQTSPQVATNVRRAIENLENLAGQVYTAATQATGMSGGTLLLLLAAFWFLRR